MTILQIAAWIVTLTAVLSYLNARYLRLPPTIGLMIISLLGCLGVLWLDRVGFVYPLGLKTFLATLDFNQAFIQGMLSFLLFAGALHIDLAELKKNWRLVSLLSTVGLLVSILITGTGVYWLLRVFAVPVSYAGCLLFGAVISPTDPVAVLGILEEVGVPKRLQNVVSAESLFNDGVGIVAFAVLYHVISGETAPSAPHILELLLKQAAGGAAVGMALGWLASQLLDSIREDVLTQTLITLALVMGGYSAASALGASGPIAIVAAGLFISNRWPKRSEAEHVLPIFWDLIDSILNAVLFVMIGLEVSTLSFRGLPLLAGALAIPLALLARWLSVEASALLSFSGGGLKGGVREVLVWGGLRGGVAVALALSLPAGPQKSFWLTATYLVVAFSIIVQGLTVGPLARKTAAD